MNRLAPLVAVLAASCTTLPAAEAPLEERVVGEGGQCEAPPAQRLVGQRATQALGGEVLRLTRAAILRWGPPDSAFTMDYRPDRVSVSYDRAMVVTAISCG